MFNMLFFIILAIRILLDYVELLVIYYLDLSHDSFPPVLEPAEVVTQILLAQVGLVVISSFSHDASSVYFCSRRIQLEFELAVVDAGKEVLLEVRNFLSHLDSLGATPLEQLYDCTHKDDPNEITH